jgi:hypothetical protein
VFCSGAAVFAGLPGDVLTRPFLSDDPNLGLILSFSYLNAA